MLHVGLDLSRRRVDVCLRLGEGSWSSISARRWDRDGLYGLTRRVHTASPCAGWSSR